VVVGDQRQLEGQVVEPREELVQAVVGHGVVGRVHLRLEEDGVGGAGLVLRETLDVGDDGGALGHADAGPQALEIDVGTGDGAVHVEEDGADPLHIATQ